MEQIQQNQTQQPTKQERRTRGRGVFLACIVIIISLVAGSIGGGAAVVLSLKNSKVQKFLNINQSHSESQKVVLAEESAVIDVVKKASPAVVSIVISKTVSSRSTNPFFMDPFNFFGMGGMGNEGQSNPSTDGRIQEVGAGSGFLVTKDGYILTNKHVVADEQATYKILLNDGRSFDGKVVARDSFNDIAIVKIDIQDAPILELANSADLQVGQRVIAIGNSLGQYHNTVTTGIISGIGRSITAGGQEGSEQLEGVIQTDAAINPGNSGGPLLNALGQVVGINTAVDQQGQLVGFAIPSSDANRSLSSFIKNGKITRPYLGVRYIPISKALAEAKQLPKDYGALVTRGATMSDLAIIPGSPADKAGLVENDIILEVNGKQITEEMPLSKMMRAFNTGDILDVKIYHKGEEKLIKVTLEESK